jgi:hypothetical protein
VLWEVRRAGEQRLASSNTKPYVYGYRSWLDHYIWEIMYATCLMRRGGQGVLPMYVLK